MSYYMATLILMVTVTELGPTFSYDEARRAGWSKRSLYARRDAGEIEPIARGLYRWADAEPADLELVEIGRRSPFATICLASALARHELTDENPPSINIALPRTSRPPRTTAPVTWHRFAPETFDVGRNTMGVEDVQIGLYSPERSIVDAFRLRHLYGDDLAVEALKRWLRRRGSQPAELLKVAHLFPRSEGPIRRALQILL
jgi:predicted transcriptional regulator of viral defense system